MRQKLLFLCAILLSLASTAQVNPITENTKISILTVDVAEDSHTLYGHTALRIQDSSTHLDVIYNYGMFDFRTENFILKFVKGDMQYYAAAYPYADFEYSYHEENRSIFEQELNISFAEKRALFEKLNASLFSEGRFYTYKFIDRNCTTKVIDIVNEVLQDKPIKNTLHQDESYRTVLFPYANHHFYMQLGINIIFGTRVDNPAEILFLPLDLMNVLKTTSYKGKPLVTDTRTNFKAERNPVFSFLDSIYSLIAVLLLIVLLNHRLLTIFYFTLLGLIGLLFSVIGFYSFHQELLWNYNVLLLNPLLLVLVYFMFRNNTQRIIQVARILLAFIAIYVAYMTTKVHLWIVLPIVIANTILLLRLLVPKK